MDIQSTHKHFGIVMPVDLAGMNPGEYMNAIAAEQDGAMAVKPSGSSPEVIAVRSPL